MLKIPNLTPPTPSEQPNTSIPLSNPTVPCNFSTNYCLMIQQDEKSTQVYIRPIWDGSSLPIYLYEAWRDVWQFKIIFYE